MALARHDASRDHQVINGTTGAGRIILDQDAAQFAEPWTVC